MADSFRDHGLFLAGNRKYATIMQDYAVTGDTAAFARGLQQAGYATDPNYAAMIAAIVARYDLNRYNVKRPDTD